MTSLMWLIAPWGVGPAPSAHALKPGLELSASASTLLGKGPALMGGELQAGYSTHRLFVSLAAQNGTGWTTCPDCQSLAATATVRGVLIRHEAVQLAPWVVLTGAGGLDFTPGVALEGGTNRVRFDTSWPLWSTNSLLTTLRITPELGASYHWSTHQSSRLAVVGLEPGVALQHRVRLTDTFVVEGVARYGEEGFGLLAALRFRP